MVDPLLADEVVEVNLPGLGRVRGQPEFVALAARAAHDGAAANARWVAEMRSIGIKAAHPDDGWVDRKKSQHHDFVQFCYPQFDDGVAVGDRIALGWWDRYRVRYVQAIEKSRLFDHVSYQVVK